MKPILFDLAKDYFIGSKDPHDRNNYDQQPYLKQAVPFVLDKATFDASNELLPVLNPDLVITPYDTVFMECEGVGMLAGPAYGDLSVTEFTPQTHLRFDLWAAENNHHTAYPSPVSFFLGRNISQCYVEDNYYTDAKGRKVGFGPHKIARRNATLFEALQLRNWIFDSTYESINGWQKPWRERIGVIANSFVFEKRKKELDFGITLIFMAVLAVMGKCRLSQRELQHQGIWRARRNIMRPHTVHTVVTIDTSERPLREQLEHRDTHPGVKEHDVRGHWRTLRRGKPDEYRVRVRPHTRGNAELGRVIHDHYQTSNIERQDA